MASGNTSENGDFGFQIAPMVDVVFVLMLFFMASVGYESIKYLTISPSGTGDPSNVPVVKMFLDVDAAGNVFVNNQPYSASAADRKLLQLREMLAINAQTSPEDPVIIRPHAKVRHGRIMQVLDACKYAKVQKISFASK